MLILAGFSAMPAAAQSRKQVGFTTVKLGNFESSATRFTEYSSGVGTLGRQSIGSASGGVLSSSIYSSPAAKSAMTPTRSHVNNAATGTIQQPNYTITRRIDTGGRTAGTSMTPTIPTMGAGTANAPMRSTAILSPKGATVDLPSSVLSTDFDKSPASIQRNVLPILYSTGMDYSTALSGSDDVGVTDQQDEITSFVPEVPGRYRDLMERAEDAFRKAKYRDAMLNYTMARSLSSSSPETLLGLMHTYFASSQTSYGVTSLYLQRVLERLPELPLLKVHPRSFYGDGARYIGDLVRLENHVKEYPRDPDARLVLGYLQFRDGEMKAATESLEYAAGYAQNSGLKEAITTLWDGMVAGKFVSGKLTPKLLPEDMEKQAAETQPATQPADSATGSME